jgi:hypothetical protein
LQTKLIMNDAHQLLHDEDEGQQAVEPVFELKLSEVHYPLHLTHIQPAPKTDVIVRILRQIFLILIRIFWILLMVLNITIKEECCALG